MNTSNWSRDLGIDGLVQDLGNILPAIAFGIGLTFGFAFDTAGPRRRVVERDREVERPAATVATPVPATDDTRVVRRDADEPITAEREADLPEPPTVPVGGLNDETDDDRHVTTTTTTTRREDR
jgi:hypothetical protein